MNKQTVASLNRGNPSGNKKLKRVYVPRDTTNLNTVKLQREGIVGDTPRNTGRYACILAKTGSAIVDKVVANGGNSPKPSVIEQLQKAGESIVKALKGTTCSGQGNDNT